MAETPDHHFSSECCPNATRRRKRVVARSLMDAFRGSFGRVITLMNVKSVS
jgi:hypothetical protein